MNTTYLALCAAPHTLVPFEDIQGAAQTLQRQLTEHFNPGWGTAASITPLEHLSDLQKGVAPIIICDRDSLGDGATFGLHLVDDFNTDSQDDDMPFALVEYQPNKAWSRDASHECLELVIDPYGDQLLSAPDPAGYGWTVDHLVEICDPCGRESATYHLPDSPWPLSDFVLPTYYTAPQHTGGSYAYLGGLTQPRTLRPGGYLTWCHRTGQTPGQGDWYRTQYTGNGSPQTFQIVAPEIDPHKHIRQWVDLASREFLATHSRSRHARDLERRMLAQRRVIERQCKQARKARRARWKKTLAALLSGQKAGKKKAGGKKPRK